MTTDADADRIARLIAERVASGAPLVDPEVDLSGMECMMLDTQLLLDSSLAIKATDAEFRGAVFLWCTAWREKPHGSLPSDDAFLRVKAGCGNDRRKWQRIRAMALHKFVRASDGRLYHPVIAKDVWRAWGARQKAKAKTAAASAARWPKPGAPPSRTPTASPSRISVTDAKSIRNGSPVSVDVRRSSSRPESDPALGEGGRSAFGLIEGLIRDWPKAGAESKASNVWTRIVAEGASPTEVDAGARAYLESVRGEPVKFVPQLHRFLEEGRWRKVTPKGATVGAATEVDQRRILIARWARFRTHWRPEWGDLPSPAEVDAANTSLDDHMRAFAAHRVRWDEATWGRRPTAEELRVVTANA